MAETYTVLKIDELSRLSDTRGIERYYRVQIRTKGKTLLTVDVGESDYTPAKMDPILKAHAVESDKILAL